MTRGTFVNRNPDAPANNYINLSGAVKPPPGLTSMNLQMLNQPRPDHTPGNTRANFVQ